MAKANETGAEKVPKRRGRPPKNPAAASAPAVQETPKKAFVFFNCNEGKTNDSKNIFHNNEVFRDVIAARKVLWNKVKSEIEAGRVHYVDENSATIVRKEILEGSPAEASKYLQFGAIDEINYF